jgi:membrane-associated phospholipid phosphatase
MKHIIEKITIYYPSITCLVVIYLLFTNFDFGRHLIILLLLSSVINTFLKESIFRPIMKDKIYPIIGQGSRPNNIESSISYIRNSYGMPSAHAQNASVFSLFLIYMIMKSDLKKTEKNVLIFILMFFVLLVMYGRVYLTKVHTNQQVIIGYIIGYLIFMMYYKNIKFSLH